MHKQAAACTANHCMASRASRAPALSKLCSTRNVVQRHNVICTACQDGGANRGAGARASAGLMGGDVSVTGASVSPDLEVPINSR